MRSYRYWSDEERTLFAQLYAATPNKELAVLFNRPIASICRYAVDGFNPPLRKTSETMRVTRGQAHGRPVGAERTVTLQNGYCYKQTKVGPGTWRFTHRLRWEEVNGPVPVEHVLRCQGDRLNTDPSNWVAVPRSSVLTGRPAKPKLPKSPKEKKAKPARVVIPKPPTAPAPPVMKLTRRRDHEPTRLYYVDGYEVHVRESKQESWMKQNPHAVPAGPFKAREALAA